MTLKMNTKQEIQQHFEAINNDPYLKKIGVLVNVKKAIRDTYRTIDLLEQGCSIAHCSTFKRFPLSRIIIQKTINDLSGCDYDSIRIAINAITSTHKLYATLHPRGQELYDFYQENVIKPIKTAHNISLNS